MPTEPQKGHESEEGWAGAGHQKFYLGLGYKLEYFMSWTPRHGILTWAWGKN